MLYQITDWDDAYSNGKYIVDSEAYLGRWQSDSKTFREEQPHEKLGLGYLFLPKNKPQGLMVFIHGGYWIESDPTMWSYLAAGALTRGWACHMPGYPLAPNARISQITAYVAAEITRAAAQINGPIAVTGHSAGGHLAARMVCPGVLADGVAKRITACVPIAPLADLRPLMRTKMQTLLALDPAEAQAESPALIEPRPGIPVTTWVGGSERPEFIRQANLLANAWAGLGTATECVIDPGRHHYNIMDPLADADSPLMNRLL